MKNLLGTNFRASRKAVLRKDAQNKLRLTLLAAAMATLSAPTFAASALELYGKLNVSVQNTDADAGDKWEAVSNASRLGVKGELGIDEGFSAFYQIEMEVDPTEKAGSSTGAGTGDGTLLKSRNVGVGLKGSAGQVLVGRWDTPLKLAQQKVDLFNDTSADMKAIFNGEVRANDIISYSSPKIAGGLVFNVSTLLVEDLDNPATPADEEASGLGDATSMSIEWHGKSLFLAYAHDDGFTSAAPTVAEEDLSVDRFVVQYKIGDFQLGGMFQEYDNGVDDETDGTLFSVAYKVTENNTLKLQHGSSDIIGEKGEMTYFGWDHNLAKNVMFFAFYGETTFDNDALDLTHLAAGLEVKF